MRSKDFPNKFKQILLYSFICLSLWALGACSEEPTGNDSPSSISYEWMDAGLNMPGADDSGGVHTIAAVGEYLFAMDPRQIDFDSSDQFTNKAWRIWMGKVGSQVWDTLSLPREMDYSYELYASNNRLYIFLAGAKEIWSFEPEKKDWRKEVDSSSIDDFGFDRCGYGYGMAFDFNGKTVLSCMGFEYSKCWYGDLETKTGENIPCPGANKDIGLLRQTVEHNDYLYGVSYDYGVFRWKPGMAKWDSLPSARGRNETIEVVDLCAELWEQYNGNPPSLGGVTADSTCPTEIATNEVECVKSIESHKGHIYIGYGCNAGRTAGIFRLEDDDSWTHITPSYMSTNDFGEEFNMMEAATETFDLLSVGDHLLSTGEELGIPMIWRPQDEQNPAIGDWHILDEGFSYGVPRTKELVVVGDTLYAAAWYGVKKLPLSYLDSMGHRMFKAHHYPDYDSTATEE